VSHLADICRSWFRKASAGYSSPALATLQYSHGSMFTPSTPQLEHLIATSWRLAAISETIEQKWWKRVKLTSGIVLSQQQPFACKIKSGMNHVASSLLLSYYFCEKKLHQFKRKKQVSPLLWDVRGSDDDCGCSASCWGRNVDEELFSETRKENYIDLSGALAMCCEQR